MHESYKKWLEDDKPKVFCQCGCNKEIIIISHHKYDGIPKYIRGHYIRSDIDIKNMSERFKGDKNPSKRPEIRKKMSLIAKERLSNPINHPMYGKYHTEESKEKNRKSNKNHIPWNKHKTSITDNRILSGSNASNWQGGISYLPYCYKFNEILKKKTRERDNYQCQYPNCLCTQLESLVLYSQSLHVHHIHYKKEDCDPDLIALCIKHNSIVNFNRNYWEELFMNILKGRGIIK